MLTAILSAMPDGDCTATFGISVLERQLDFALMQGCAVIVCVADSFTEPLRALQMKAERAGARFLCVSSLRALPGLVDTTGRLLVLQAGVVFDGAALADILCETLGEKGEGILALSSDSGASEAFERIDRERRFAGAMVLPGSVAALAATLAEDADPVAALLRLALQAEVGAYNLHLDQAATSSLAVITSRADAQRWQVRRAATLLSPADWRQPAFAMTDRAALRLVLGDRCDATTANAAAVALVACLIGGAACLAFALPAMTLFFATLALLATRFGQGIAKLRALPFAGRRTFNRARYRATLIMAVAISVVACVIAEPAARTLDVLFAAVMLLGILALYYGGAKAGNYRVFGDPALIAAVLGAAIFSSATLPTLQVTALGNLFLLLSRDRTTALANANLTTVR